jgi:hypothetical protein
MSYLFPRFFTYEISKRPADGRVNVWGYLPRPSTGPMPGGDWVVLDVVADRREGIRVIQMLEARRAEQAAAKRARR